MQFMLFFVGLPGWAAPLPPKPLLFDIPRCVCSPPLSQEEAQAVRELLDREAEVRAGWEAAFKAARAQPDRPELWKAEVMRLLGRLPSFPLDPEAWARSALQTPKANPAPIDRAAKGRWQEEFDTIRELLSSSKALSANEREELQSRELLLAIWEGPHARARGERGGHAALFAKIAERAPLMEGRIQVLVDHVFRYQHRSGVSEEDLWFFVEALKQSSSAKARHFGRGRERMLSLARAPMEYRARTLEGQTLDLEQYRGKYVLLQIWPYG